jgi:hypothetical protein
VNRFFITLCLVAASFTVQAADDTPPVTDPAPLVPGHQGVTYPQLLHAPLPVYPQHSSRASIYATVRTRFVVLASGEVVQVTIEDSSMGGEATTGKSPDGLAGTAVDFEASARRALLGRRYAPAMKNAKPVPVQMELTFEFSPEERLALNRWGQVKEGLQALATSEIIPEGSFVAGEDDVSFPVAVKQRAPIQPHGARVRGLRSRVLLLLLVDKEGLVQELPLSRAEVNEYTFVDSAEAAVRRWRFTPAEKDGEPVAAYHWLQLTIPEDPVAR